MKFKPFIAYLDAANQPHVQHVLSEEHQRSFIDQLRAGGLKYACLKTKREAIAWGYDVRGICYICEHAPRNGRNYVCPAHCRKHGIAQCDTLVASLAASVPGAA